LINDRKWSKTHISIYMCSIHMRFSFGTPFGSIWIAIWVHLGRHLGPFGYIWVHLGSFGSIWVNRRTRNTYHNVGLFRCRFIHYIGNYYFESNESLKYDFRSFFKNLEDSSSQRCMREKRTTTLQGRLESVQTFRGRHQSYTE
jgi:hypothetical protein